MDAFGTLQHIIAWIAKAATVPDLWCDKTVISGGTARCILAADFYLQDNFVGTLPWLGLRAGRADWLGAGADSMMHVIAVAVLGRSPSMYDAITLLGPII